MIRSWNEMHGQRTHQALEKSDRVSWLSVVYASDRQWFHCRERTMLSLKMPVVEIGDGQVKINGLIHDRHYSSLLSFYIKEESFYRAFSFDRCCSIRQKNRIIRFLFNFFKRILNKFTIISYNTYLIKNICIDLHLNILNKSKWQKISSIQILGLILASLT